MGARKMRLSIPSERQMPERGMALQHSRTQWVRREATRDTDYSGLSYTSTKQVVFVHRR